MSKSKLTEAQRLADMLHDRIHPSDCKNSGCSWKYNKNPWSDPQIFEDEHWPYKWYLKRANCLLLACDGSFEKAQKMVTAIFGH